MEFLNLFHAPMFMAVRWPAAPFLIAAVFALGQLALMWRHRWRFNVHMWRRPALFACAIWLVYGLYELQVQATWHTGNIRFDLLVLAPILYVFSAVGAWWFLRCWRDPAQAVVRVPEEADSPASANPAATEAQDDSRPGSSGPR